MSSLRQGVASAVDADVRIALQKMSSDFVRDAVNGAKDSAAAAAAAHDAMSLQDALYGVSAAVTEQVRKPKHSASAPATTPAETYAAAASAGQNIPKRETQRFSRRSGRPSSTGSKSFPVSFQSPSKKPLVSASSVQLDRMRKAAVPPSLRHGPSSASRPTVATDRKKPPSRVLDEDLLPGTEGLPPMLRRRPSLVLKVARGKSAPEREQMIATARAALSSLHKGTFPTPVARPAGDRAHAILKGIERMQLTAPAVRQAGASKRKKSKKKLRGGLAMAGASLAPGVRKQLEKTERDAAASAKSRNIDTVAQLPLSSRPPIYRGYGIPVSGGLPSLGRRN